ncbi:MAG: phthalyl amidase [Acidimicrobiia bacterium]|nr:phthalyl amidase [Acidimicrobiia bacterium]
MKRLALALSLLLFTVIVAPTASSAAQPPWFVEEDSLPFFPLGGYEDAEQMWGVHNDAGYRIEVPANWNGDLIMWTHGYRGEDPELLFNPSEFNPGFRAWMLGEGYAWAASTYSKNSYNVSQGVKDTHALTQFFNGKVGQADDVYIAGYSMGGHIAAVLAENYGNTYSGAMPLCGVVGDYELFDYFLDVNAAAQHLALGTSQIPADADFFTDEFPQIRANLGLPFATTPAGQQFKQLVELRSGGDRPEFDAAFVFWNSVNGIFSGEEGAFLFDLGAGDGVVPATGGKWSVVDNTDAVYQVDLDPAISDFEAQLNADIARVAADPQARTEHGLRNPPPVTGDLRMPVLTMHNLGDLFVPWHNEIAYANDVAAHGKSDMLVQRAIRGVLHCDFTDAELIEGMSDLIDWAQTGVRPDGDMVLDPAVVADPNYGCNYTRGGHPFGTPCP